MSSSAVQIRFAVEFATFLVAIAGAALVALRPALLGASSRARVILPVGFVAIATAAFLHGSLLVGDEGEAIVAAVRLSGIVLVALGTIRWDTEPTFRRMLLAGLLLLGVAEALQLADLDNAANWVRAGGTLGLIALGLVLQGDRLSLALAAGALLYLAALLLMNHRQHRGMRQQISLGVAYQDLAQRHVE